MTGPEKGDLAREMARAVAMWHRDPAEWLFAARTLAERMGLDPTRCIPLGSVPLSQVCWAILDEASKQGRAPDHVGGIVRGYRGSEDR